MLLITCFWMSFVIIALGRFAIQEILGIEIESLFGWIMIVGLTSAF
ncbi:MAG: hypothetical protein AB4063_17175 [Crocosphaera sp.]